MLKGPFARSWHSLWIRTIFEGSVSTRAEGLVTLVLDAQSVDRVMIPYVNSCVVVNVDLPDTMFVGRVILVRHVCGHDRENEGCIEAESRIANRVHIVARNEFDLVVSTIDQAEIFSEAVEVPYLCIANVLCT